MLLYEYGTPAAAGPVACTFLFLAHRRATSVGHVVAGTDRRDLPDAYGLFVMSQTSTDKIAHNRTVATPRATAQRCTTVRQCAVTTLDLPISPQYTCTYAVHREL